MRVLLTNVELVARAGSQLYLLDVACWLRDQGHRPMVYSARLGPVAEEVRRESIPVVTDLDRLPEAPDVIHGQHHLATMAALATFPLVPAVYVCHGWIPWEESPPVHPAIRRYVAVSAVTRERVVSEAGIDPGIVRVIPNFVDTGRFRPRAGLPDRPGRALVFSNQTGIGGWLEDVRAACKQRGIAVDVAGIGTGRTLTDPDRILPDYDLVFARGRSALEAMAVGAAVVLCDMEGCGPFVTPDDFDRLQDGNFGQMVLRQPHNGPYLGEQIDRYDAATATAVSQLVRGRLARDRIVPTLVQVYEEAVADVAAHPHGAEEARSAERAYLRWVDQNFPAPLLEARVAIQRGLDEVVRQQRALAADRDSMRERAERAESDTLALRAEVDSLRREALHVPERIDREREATAREREEATRQRAEATRQREEAARLREAMHRHRQRAEALAGSVARLERELAEARSDAERTRGELEQLRSGFLVRLVLPRLWSLRRRLAPHGSRRDRAYRSARATGGRLLARPGRPWKARDPTGGAVDEDGDDLTCVVLDVGGQPGLVAAVRSLATQRPRPEIVVVSSGAEGAEALLAGSGALVVHASRLLYAGGARNAGIAAGHGRYIAFLAADSLAEPGWVAGRLAAHRSGAGLVSTPVTNAYRWNPFAAAVQTLLFPGRRSWTPESARLHYGVSYDRSLLAPVGAFRSDLRTGEDTELNERLARRPGFTWRGDVRTAHRNPRTPWGLVSDQFARGRRTVEARAALYGGNPRQVVAADAIRRVPRSLALSLRHAPIGEWGPTLVGLPWVLPGAVAYAAGAVAARPRPQRAARASSPERRLVAVVPFHDELAELPALLENLAPQVDGIIALDDGSTDGGARIMRDHPAVLEVLRVGSRTPHDWDEVRNRRLLVDAAARHGARWIVAVDADERLERGFRLRAEALIERAGPDGPGAYWVTIRELWDGPAQYRVDGVWGRKRSARLFRCRPDHDFGSLVYHGHWAPENSRGPDGDFAAADLVIYHRAMISPADREARKERHKRLDPDRRWQAMGYDYMTDETGLHLEPLPPGREYQPEAG